MDTAEDAHLNASVDAAEPTLKERWQANIWLRRIVLLGGGTTVLVLVLTLVDRLGFHLMVTNYALRPERLRDVTFPIWRHEPITRHGFLVFLAPKDFAAKIAYSNHSTAYLFVMYALSLLTRIWARLDLRSMSAYVEMMMLLGVLVWQIRQRAKVQLQSLESLLLLGMLAVVMTEPGFWISAGKFNVDNPFHFVVPLMMMACYQLAYRERRDRWFWASLVVFAVFAPLPAVLLAVFIGLKMIGGQSYRKSQPLLLEENPSARDTTSGWR